MGYAVEDCMVRVDRFKETGKWYDSISLDMEDFYNVDDLHWAVQECLRHFGFEIHGWIYICLEPYHKNAHPVMLKGRV